MFVHSEGILKVRQDPLLITYLFTRDGACLHPAHYRGQADGGKPHPYWVEDTQ
jgi:hypothetical protein